MSDVLSRIFGPANIASGTSTIFTGTASHIYTIKKIMVLNNSSSAISVKLGIGGVADANLILPYVSIGAGEWIEFDGLFVLTGAETFQANASASGLTITAHGLDQGALTPGSVELVYAYTVTGSDKASIDTGVDTADAGSGVWSNGDLLEAYIYCRTDEATTGSIFDITFNNDTGSNYIRQSHSGNNTATTAAYQSAMASWQLVCPGSSSVANVFGVYEIIIPNFTGTVGYKEARASSVRPTTTGAASEIDTHALAYHSTSAITRFKMIPDTAGKKFIVGSQLLIYKRKRTA